MVINNYRNLDGITVFDSQCNFIVGDNNIGKSNFLSLLNTIFNFRSFHADDFKDPSKPIEISIQLKLAEVEIGHFEDLFDIEDYSIINIFCQQINPDENIEFYHQETKTYINISTIRCINFVHYDSLRNPITEISFDKRKGVGRFLKSIIQQYLNENEISDTDFFMQDKVDNLIRNINEKIQKIKPFKDFKISASTDDDIENLLSKVVIFKDDKGDSLLKAGYGVQFLILVTLSILEKLQSIIAQRKNRGMLEDSETETKAISLVLGLDEPEIHLHPYMQRSLIKYLNSIINNHNPEFTRLIKELFDIDLFIGQIIVVTHSPNIILDDYRQIIRFYMERGAIKVVSGTMLTLSPQLEKHLYLNFPYIKEAFSHTVPF